MKKDISPTGQGMTTLFERILSGEIPSHPVARGEGWYAFLDIFPRREGHTLVIPTRPVQRLASLQPDERAALMNGVAEVQRRLGHHFSPPPISPFAFTMDLLQDRKSPTSTFMSFRARLEMEAER